MSEPAGEPLIFMMGNFSAEFPQDRMYCKNHMWAQRQADDATAASGAVQSLFRFGFSAYAVRLLQDVYFLEWSLDTPAEVRDKQQIGGIESKKAESDLFAPAAGTLLGFNAELLVDPSAINVDKYARGWLFEMQTSGDKFLTPLQYLEHLAAVWEITQRTIKGQLNE